jgi:hypothetical protein
MRSGSIAVIAPNKKKPLVADQLRVRNSQLHLRASAGGALTPLTGHDYMLLRIEGGTERDDWRLPDIDVPLKRALICLEDGNAAAAQGYRAVALAAAHESPEIAEHDRRRVIDRIKKTYAEAQAPGYGATGGSHPDLTAAMSRGIPRDRARSEGAVTEAELFV